MYATQVVLPLSLMFLQPATDLNIQIQDVVDGLKRREAAFFNSESMLLKYEWRDTDHVTLSSEDEKALEELFRKGDFAAITNRFPGQAILLDPGSRHEFAIRDKMLFMRVVNPFDLKYGVLGLTASYDGNFGVELNERHHARIDATPSPHAWQNFDYAFVQLFDVYSRISGLDAMRNIPPAVRKLRLKVDIAERADLYTIGASVEIDGKRALLIERADTHRIWIAPELGFAICRVDRFLEGSEFREEARMSSHLMSDFRRVKEDLWLPWIVTEELFVGSVRRRESARLNHAGAAAFPSLQVRRTLAVESAEFDTLKPEFFQLSLPAGIMVHDNVRNITYKNQKDGIPFNDAIEFAKANTAAQAQFPLQTVLLLLANIGIALVLLFHFLRRRMLR